MDFSKSVTGRRSLEYIRASAEELGIEYDLAETSANREALIRLWDACLGFNANDERYTAEMLQAICDDLLDASKVCVLQGVRHKEPQDIEAYQRLFNTNISLLNMVDVPYNPPSMVDTKLTWELVSDNNEVMKLTPGVQYKLPFD